eukprot:TRINITY_DN2778_c0_g1_i1.p1 TRINITY_DN2778_c0_g1~~TRINITY_DN2778_c0_g1_i1.p1  ORF type:complete len:1052 (+),score=255.56 TRINITY_DN2778_c0_g1_i1:1166-4321(+)
MSFQQINVPVIPKKIIKRPAVVESISSDENSLTSLPTPTSTPTPDSVQLVPSPIVVVSDPSSIASSPPSLSTLTLESTSPPSLKEESPLHTAVNSTVLLSPTGVNQTKASRRSTRTADTSDSSRRLSTADDPESDEREGSRIHGKGLSKQSQARQTFQIQTKQQEHKQFHKDLKVIHQHQVQHKREKERLSRLNQKELDVSFQALKATVAAAEKQATSEYTQILHQSQLAQTKAQEQMTKWNNTALIQLQSKHTLELNSLKKKLANKEKTARKHLSKANDPLLVLQSLHVLASDLLREEHDVTFRQNQEIMETEFDQQQQVQQHLFMNLQQNQRVFTEAMQKPDQVRLLNLDRHHKKETTLFAKECELEKKQLAQIQAIEFQSSQHTIYQQQKEVLKKLNLENKIKAKQFLDALNADTEALPKAEQRSRKKKGAKKLAAEMDANLKAVEETLLKERQDEMQLLKEFQAWQLSNLDASHASRKLEIQQQHQKERELWENWIKLYKQQHQALHLQEQLDLRHTHKAHLENSRQKQAANLLSLTNTQHTQLLSLVSSQHQEQSVKLSELTLMNFSKKDSKNSQSQTNLLASYQTKQTELQQRQQTELRKIDELNQTRLSRIQADSLPPPYDPAEPIVAQLTSIRASIAILLAELPTHPPSGFTGTLLKTTGSNVSGRDSARKFSDAPLPPSSATAIPASVGLVTSQSSVNHSSTVAPASGLETSDSKISEVRQRRGGIPPLKKAASLNAQLVHVIKAPPPVPANGPSMSQISGRSTSIIGNPPQISHSKSASPPVPNLGIPLPVPTKSSVSQSTRLPGQTTNSNSTVPTPSTTPRSSAPGIGSTTTLAESGGGGEAGAQLKPPQIILSSDASIPQPPPPPPPPRLPLSSHNKNLNKPTRDPGKSDTLRAIKKFNKGSLRVTETQEQNQFKNSALLFQIQKFNSSTLRKFDRRRCAVLPTTPDSLFYFPQAPEQELPSTESPATPERRFTLATDSRNPVRLSRGLQWEGLLSSVHSFKKSQLKHAVTDDRSQPHLQSSRSEIITLSHEDDDEDGQ